MKQLQLLLIICTLFVKLNHFLIIKENVVFEEEKTISTTSSKWAITFVIDFGGYERFIRNVSAIINDAEGTATRLIETYSNQPQPQSPRPSVGLPTSQFLSTISGLKLQLSYLREAQDSVLASVTDHELLRGREKRSVLPFVGSALSFLFGVTSESDLASIRKNVGILKRSQIKLTHVVADSLTIVNTTRHQVAENRQKINDFITTLQALGAEVRENRNAIERQISTLADFTTLFTHLDLIIGELSKLIQNARFELDHIRLQLNMLSLGHLSPSTFTPRSLKSLLIEIKSHLPRSLRLPENPITSLWDYYRLLTCSTVFDADHLLVIVNIPLIDALNEFQLFSVYNLPLPLYNNTINNSPALVATYKLEADAIAISSDHTRYILLSHDESRQCLTQLSSYCPIESPVYPINLSRLCILALLQGSNKRIKANCQVVVRTDQILPLARNIVRGTWVIITRHELRLTVKCPSSTSTRTINPPIEIITLNNSCSASSDYFVLLPYYFNKISAKVNDDYTTFHADATSLSFSLWDPLIKTLPAIGNISFPKKLKAVTEIPMDNLIRDLSLVDTEPFDSCFSMPTWAQILLTAVGSLIFGVVIMICYKKYKCLGALANIKQRGTNESESKDAYVRVSTTVEGTDTSPSADTTAHGKRGQTPPGTDSLGSCSDDIRGTLPQETAVAEVKALYPTLDFVRA